MKIIDLIKLIDEHDHLNELPKKIRYDGVEYICCDDDFPIKYINEDGTSLMQKLHSINDEVEIIEGLTLEEVEEDNIIKKITIGGNRIGSAELSFCLNNPSENEIVLSECIEALAFRHDNLYDATSDVYNDLKKRIEKLNKIVNKKMM